MSDISLSKAVRSNLLSLQNTASMMAKTQDRLASGNKVNSALDNPTNFFTASSLNSRAGDLNSLIDNMANGVKTLEAADNGLTSITKTLESMQSTLRQARQDKSFAVDTFEVGADSTLTVNGGRFGAATDIKLQQPSGGSPATLTTTAVYANPTPDASKSETVGAQVVINYDASLDNKALKVDGVDLGAIDGTTNVAADYQAALQTALDSKFGADKYKADVSGSNVSIQNLDPSKGSPKVEFASGVTMATKGTTEFTYDAAGVGTVTAGGQAISTGTSFDDFVAGLKAKAEDGNYTVTADATTKKIKLTSTEFAGAAPSITGLQQKSAATTTAALDLTNGGSFTIKGKGGNADQTVTIGATMTASAAMAHIGTQLTAAGYTGQTVNVTAGGAMTITAGTSGADSELVDITAGSGVTTVVETAGKDGVTNYAETAGQAGVSTKDIGAAADKFTITYGTQSADLSVVAGTNDERAKQINDQLKTAGIAGVTASFDTAGKLSFTSNAAESKTLAISGEDASKFGTATVSTGKEAVSAYKATSAVDQFVEEINRNAATSGNIRASNDNGKLRIENLSTQELGVSFDKDGATGTGMPTTHTIAGNSVREGLAKQFNELKDQLNKLSDDASFNGINLLRGDQLTITFNETGNSFMQIKAGDDRGINSQSLDISDISGVELDSDANIDKLLGEIKLAVNDVRSQASAFGSNLSIVQNRQDFTKNMINTLETGAANLTLADMNAEAANLLALQTRQSLSSSALSMASQADQSVLQLLR